MSEDSRGIEVTKGRLRESPMARALGIEPDSAGGAAVPKQLDGKVVKGPRQPACGWGEPVPEPNPDIIRWENSQGR